MSVLIKRNYCMPLAYVSAAFKLLIIPVAYNSHVSKGIMFDLVAAIIMIADTGFSEAVGPC